MHNLCILIRLIDGGIIEAAGYVAAVYISVAEFDRVCICGWGHDGPPKIFIVCRDNREIGRVNGGLQSFLRAKLKKRGVV